MTLAIDEIASVEQSNRQATFNGRVVYASMANDGKNESMVSKMTASLSALEKKRWVTSKEAKALLKVSDCHLMHLRVQGALIYKKEGNRFFYLLESELHGEKGNSIDL